MICYICQEDLRKRGRIARGVKDCDTLKCKNIVHVDYRTCKDCSSKYNECEVCRANLQAVSEKWERNWKCEKTD